MWVREGVKGQVHGWVSEFSSGLSGCVGLSRPVGKRKSEGLRVGG